MKYIYVWASARQNQQNGICAQQSLRSARASAQSDQSLRCPHEESLSYPLNAQQRFWSDWADAQADLSLRWAHMQFCRKCCAQADPSVFKVSPRWPSEKYPRWSSESSPKWSPGMISKEYQIPRFHRTIMVPKEFFCISPRIPCSNTPNIFFHGILPRRAWRMYGRVIWR